MSNQSFASGLVAHVIQAGIVFMLMPYIEAELAPLRAHLESGNVAPPPPGLGVPGGVGDTTPATAQGPSILDLFNQALPKLTTVAGVRG